MLEPKGLLRAADPVPRRQRESGKKSACREWTVGPSGPSHSFAAAYWRTVDRSR